MQQSSDRIEQGSVYRNGRPKDRRHLILNFHIKVQRKFRERQGDCFEQQFHFADFLRRMNHSLLHTAMHASSTDIPNKRGAGAAAPGGGGGGSAGGGGAGRPE